jgi:hypothetical protein
MVRVYTAVVALCAVVSLAGCGAKRNSPSATSSSAAQTETSHSGALGATSRQQAVTYADAVNLRTSDVPQLAAKPLNSRRTTRFGPFHPCDGGVLGPGRVVGVRSPRFEHSNSPTEGEASSPALLPLQSVSSTVYVTETAALASRQLAAIRTASARACIKRRFYEGGVSGGRGARPREPLLTDTKVSPSTPPLPDAPSFALRVTGRLAIAVPGTKGRSNYEDDALGFALGRVLIVLHTTGDPHPFPPGLERKLVRSLYRRAKLALHTLPPSSAPGSE